MPLVLGVSLSITASGKAAVVIASTAIRQRNTDAIRDRAGATINIRS